MLTPNQEKYLLTIPKDKRVEIKSYDPKLGKIAEQTITPIKEIDKEKLEVFFMGAGGLEISGQGDLDIYVLSRAEDFGKYLPKLVELFGEPKTKKETSIAWEFVRDNVPVELYLTDPRTESMREQVAIFVILKHDKQLLKEYEYLKHEFNGKSFRDYQRAKYEFYNKLLKPWRVGHKENTEYRRLYDPKNYWGESLRPLALRNFKRFVATIYKLIKGDNIRFDLIIGSGDSGISMTKLTGLVYKAVELNPPPVINIPLLRYSKPKIYWSENPEDFFDNSVLIPEIKKQLEDIVYLGNVLFVDDEIGVGMTARTIFKYILDIVEPNKRVSKVNFVIVAESFGDYFEFNDERANIIFKPFSVGINDVYSVISYIVPWEIEKQINEYFTEKELGSKEILNILLGLPTKELVNGKPEFSFKKNKLAEERMPNLEDLKQQFGDLLTQWLRESIAEYNNYSIEAI